MGEKANFNHRLATVAWGVLFIWWGMVIVIDPLTIGIGVLGTGLVLLGVNAVRWMRGLPVKNDNTMIGASLILWGGLDYLRHLLGLSPWLSFGLVFFVIGAELLFIPLLFHTRLHTSGQTGDV